MQNFGFIYAPDKQHALAGYKYFRSFVALYDKSWNDYGYSTYFRAFFHHNQEQVELAGVRILVNNEKESVKKILSSFEETPGIFPIKDLSYISLPTSISFYTNLLEYVDLRDLLDALLTIHDVVVLDHFDPARPELMMRSSEGFRVSLLRESSCELALKSGLDVLFAHNKKQVDRSFSYQPTDLVDFPTLRFNFSLEEFFPSRINLLIGKNGLGKTSCLRSLAAALQGDVKEADKLFSPSRPLFEKVIYLSYSPFEPPFGQGSSRNARDRFTFYKESKDGLRFSSTKPMSDSVESMKRILLEDIQNTYFFKWGGKYQKLLDVLSKAIDFDSIGFVVANEESHVPVKNMSFSESMQSNYSMLLNNLVDVRQGICFFKSGKLIELSSGQRLFACSVVNIIAAIADNSLVIMDEPELYLHPNLEIDLIRLLREILEKFNSYGIIASHSLVLTREISKINVLVLSRQEGKTVVSKPTFETFGADLEKIGEYIFGDIDITKSYQEWLDKLPFNSENEIYEKYGKYLNEQALLYLLGKHYDKNRAS